MGKFKICLHCQNKNKNKYLKDMAMGMGVCESTREKDPAICVDDHCIGENAQAAWAAVGKPRMLPDVISGLPSLVSSVAEGQIFWFD